MNRAYQIFRFPAILFDYLFATKFSAQVHSQLEN